MNQEPNAISIVDSHVHLQHYEQGVDISAILDQAVAAGVSHFVCNGTAERDWQQVLDLAKINPRVIPCLGLHPWFVGERSDDWYEVLEGLVKANLCGVGEVGLDRLVAHRDDVLQEEVFRKQLRLARKFNRPVMVHCVKNWGRLVDILNEEPEIPSGLLMHAYSGSVDMVNVLARKGAYFTFFGNVLNEYHKRAREALCAVPSDRLLIESDAPYMFPANLPIILAGIAELLGEPVDELRDRLWQNSIRFFAPIINSVVK